MENSDQKFRELLDRYLKGTATPAERDLLDEFFESYQADAATHKFKGDEREIRAKLLQVIHARTKGQAKVRRLQPALWLSLAASVSFFVIAYFFLAPVRQPRPFGQKLATLEKDSTGPGQRIVRTLPDGSKVHLNGASMVSYEKAFGDVREVFLSGEAYFEVVPDSKPFIVRSGDVSTRVLGTSFNVKHRCDARTEITLVHGRVNVSSSRGDSVDLHPGEQAVFATQSGITKRNVDAMRYACWKDNVLFFEQTSLDQAIREIEEWYSVQIVIANPALRPCTITAKYQNEPLGNVLSSLQFLHGLEIKRLNERKFLIDGSGCH